MGSRGARADRGSGSPAAAGDASFMSPTDDFDRFIRRRCDVDPSGKFDLIAHGTPRGIQIEHNGDKILVNSRVAAQLIRRLPGYDGQNIRLLSCNTGSLSDGFAQNLANKLNVTVYAPNDTLWAWPSGYHAIAAPRPSRAHPGRMEPDMTRRGRFVQYTPGGNRR